MKLPPFCQLTGALHTMKVHSRQVHWNNLNKNKRILKIYSLCDPAATLVHYPLETHHDSVVDEPQLGIRFYLGNPSCTTLLYLYHSFIFLSNIYLFISVFHPCNNHNNFLKFWHFLRRSHLDWQ